MRKCLLALLCLTGCMSVGQKITPEQIASLQQGVTTEQQAIAALGKPSSSTPMPDGSKIDSWINTGAQFNATSLLPMAGTLFGGNTQLASSLLGGAGAQTAGALMGSAGAQTAGALVTGTKISSNTLTLTFDTNGVLTAKTTSASQTASNSGAQPQ